MTSSLISQGFSRGKILAIGLAALLGITILFFGGRIVENVDADEILVVQDPWDGELHWYTTPGIKLQGFGRATIYPRVLSYAFSGQIRFNEGGHGNVLGSIQFRLPLDTSNLTAIYTTYSNAEALQSGLLSVVTDKSIFMTGPLLSSTESYAEKRSNLIFWVEDQINNGVYRTTRRDIKTKDPITGEEKTVTVAEIAVDATGRPQRQETSPLGSFGIHPFNFAVKNVEYDQTVEAQIQTQQKNAMAVQTAVAEARKAEQEALTVEQQGRASAAKAKWEQETIKAKAVTEAQQQLEVAQLDAKAAAQERQANILRGEGEAARRRLVMQADGALDRKTEVWLEAQKVWAEAIAKYQGSWVPNMVLGGGSGAQGIAGSGALTLIELLTAKTARDLQLDLTARRSAPKDDN